MVGGLITGMLKPIWATFISLLCHIISSGGSGLCSTVFGSLCGGLGLSGINDFIAALGGK